MNLYALLLDAVLVIIALWCVASGFRKGFLRVVSMAVWMTVFILAVSLWSGPLAQWGYTRFLEEPVLAAVHESVESGSLEAYGAVDAVFEALPGILKDFMLDSLGVRENLNSLIGQTASESVRVVAEEIIAPILISALQALICLLIFFICVIIGKMLNRLLERFNRVPVLGPLNAVLGAAAGVVQAGLILYILCVTAQAVIGLTNGSLSWLNREIIADTYLFRSLCALWAAG